MATTLASSTGTEQYTIPVVEHRNGVDQHTQQSLYQPRWDAPDHGRYVSKEEYWAKWYEASPSYEWNDGYLEAKLAANFIQLRLFHWFFRLLHQYIQTYHNAELMSLETGFSMIVPNSQKPGAMKEVTRKPDLAAIRHDNPVRWLEHERSYHGICDLCVEAISDSDPGEINRDIKIKKSEYEFAGVQEYYILDPTNQHMHFYQRNAAGVYIEMQPDADGILRSQILPGFQFRRSDLNRQSMLEELALDPVYQGYVLLRYQAATKQAAQERQRAEQEQQRAEHEQQRAEHERQRAEQEQQRADRYAAKLRELGIDVE